MTRFSTRGVRIRRQKQQKRTSRGATRALNEHIGAISVIFGFIAILLYLQHPKSIQFSSLDCLKYPNGVLTRYFNILGYYSPHGPHIEHKTAKIVVFNGFSLFFCQFLSFFVNFVIQFSLLDCQNYTKRVLLWYFNVLAYYGPHKPCIEHN